MCLAWHPLWEVIGRAAGVRRQTVAFIMLYLDAAPELPLARTAEVVAATIGNRRLDKVERVLAQLRERGIIDAAHRLSSGWASEKRPVQKPDGKPDAASENRTPTGRQVDAPFGGRVLSANPSSVRSRRKYWRDKGLGDAAGLASENRTPVRSDAPSLCLFPVNQQQEQKQTNTPRAREASEPDAGFARLRAIWPIDDRLVEAEAEYWRYRRRHTADAIQGAAERYLATKPQGRWCQFLLHWLRADPCRDPPLPLGGRPQDVGAEAQPPLARIDWRALGDRWVATRDWPPDAGPAPDRPECRMPEGLLQHLRRRARGQERREAG